VVKVTFFKHKGDYKGFEFSGHSGYALEGADIVCAAVSSAAYLTANNITDFFKVKDVDVTVSDGYMKLTAENDECINPLLGGLYAHMLQLQEQYENEIIVKNTEV
jgi:uncharacterized protein YsxB (DUF464 family)